MPQAFLQWRVKLYQSGMLGWAVALFLAGFVAATTTRGHRDFFYFLVLIPLLFFTPFEVWKDLIKSRVFQVFLVFIGWLLLSLLWAPGVDIDLVYDIIRWALLIALFVVSVAVVAREPVEFLSKAIIILAPVVLFALSYSILSFYDAGNFPGSRLENMLFYSDSPIRGTFGIGCAAVFFIYASLEERLDGRVRLLALAGLFAGLAFLLMAQSRGLLLGVAAAMGLGLLLHGRFVAVSVLAALSLAAVLVIEFLVPDMRGFLERGSTYRLDIWTVAVERIANNPWYGEGVSADMALHVPWEGRTWNSPHNVFLSSLILGGWPAFALLLVLLTKAFQSCVCYGKASRVWYPLGVLVFGLVVINLSGHEIIYRMLPHLWLGLWLALGLAIAAERLSQLPEGEKPAALR